MASAASNLLVPRLAAVASGGVAFYTSGVTFRDLADFSHWIHTPHRDTVMKNFARRHELTAAYLGSTAINLGIYYTNPNILPTKIAGVPRNYLMGAFSVLNAGMWFIGYINPEIMMRPRNQNALYVTVPEADKIIRPEETLIVAQVPRENGKSEYYAFADNQIQRPHIANLGTTKNGQPAIFAYCALSGGGIAFEYPEKPGGKKRDPIPYIQLENNLIVFDRANGEWGHQLQCFNQTELLEAMGETNYDLVDRRPKDADFEKYNVKPWEEIPTFRMTWNNFEKAFPDNDKVFINDYREHPNFKRPVLTAYDKIMQFIWKVFIGYHKHSPKPVFNTVPDIDPRLYSKTRVWGCNVGDEWTCLTEEFVKWEKGSRNFTLGGKKLVASWDPEFESVGIFVRPDDKPITNMVNVYGQEVTKDGKVVRELERLNTVKPGIFWFVWSNFYPKTSINLTE